MISIAAVLVVALTTAVLATPLVRWAALRTGVVDHSDGKRKLHAAPVPLLGGAAVLLSIVAGLAAAGSSASFTALSGWMTSAALICVVGWCDDVWGLTPRWKIVGQTLAALPVVAAEWQTTTVLFGAERLELGWWGAPLVLLWLLACMNAMNFIDGIDGLATSCGMIAAAFLATISEARGATPVLLASVALSGALGGFLVFNLAPARIYLGDAGSMLIGLSLAVFAWVGLRDATGAVELAPMGMLLAIPLLDLTLAVARRLLSGRPFWQADRFHMHHRLLERGCSVHEATSLLAGLSVLAGVGAVTMAATGYVWQTLLIAGAALTLLARGKFVAHHEWRQLRRLMSRTMLMAAARIGEQSLGNELPSFAELSALSDDEAWERFREALAGGAIARIEITAGREQAICWSDGYEFGAAGVIGDPDWTLQLDFQGVASGWCRMELHLSGAAAASPWQWLQALTTLHHFGRYWANHPPREEAVVFNVAGRKAA